MNLSFSNLLLYIHRSKTETEHSWYHYESENLSCLIKLEKLHFNFMLFRYVYEGVHMCVCARVCVRACVGVCVRASACVYVHVLTTISTNKIQWLEGKKKSLHQSQFFHHILHRCIQVPSCCTAVLQLCQKY